MRSLYSLRGTPLVALLAFPILLAAQEPATQSSQASSLDEAFKEAVAAYESGKFADATQQLEKLQISVPKSFEVHELLGLTYGAQSQDTKAVEQLQIAVELNPQSAPARTNLATGMMHAGKPQEAETELRRVLELEPDNYIANHDLAKLFVREDKISNALPYLETAQRSHPTSSDNGYDLALAYLLIGRFKEARTLIETLPDQDKSGELHNLLGRLDEKEGKFVEAATEFATAAHLDPSEDNLFVWASELMVHRAYVPAIDVFKEATRRFPTSPRLWVGLGMSLYSRGDYEPSIHALITGADLNPKDPRCYLFLSKAYLSSPSHAEDVIERFRKYASLEPNNAMAQYYYAISLWKGRRVDHPEIDYKTVESLLKKTLVIDDNFADAHLQLGIVYNDQHEYVKSFPEYMRALELDPNLAHAHFRLGRYYSRIGEKDKAQSEFDIFKRLSAEHQADVDRVRAEVLQFDISDETVPSQP